MALCIVSSLSCFLILSVGYNIHQGILYCNTLYYVILCLYCILFDCIILCIVSSLSCLIFRSCRGILGPVRHEVYIILYYVILCYYVLLVYRAVPIALGLY
jgi:hypothetical protein